MPESQEARSMAVTGIGLVTPLGLSAAATVGRSRRGDSAIARIERFQTDGHASTAGAEVPDFELESSLRLPKNTKFMSASVACAMRAALEALATSRLPLDQMDGGRIAVHTGSGHTGLEYTEFFQALALAWEGGREQDYKYVGVRASKLIDRYFSLRTLSNAALGLLSHETGARGPGSNFVHSDTASAMALQAACFDLIDGRCDAAVVGGYDSLLRSPVFLAFERAGLLSSSVPAEAYRPFDVTRNGLVLGEGAGFFVLERMPDAVRRGATILGEIVGIGSAMEFSGPAGLPQEKATFHRAIEGSGSEVSEIDFVVARGIGTPEDDRREAEALVSILGGGIPVTCLKSHTGYLGAATAAVELGIGLLCARQGEVPPIARLASPDPACPLDFVYGSPRTLARPAPAGLFLSSSWGGHMVAVCARALRS